MLELRHIGKSFPGVTALDDVSVAFAPGEIHALAGENGAGKSTLMKIIAGIYRPDAGEVWLDGQRQHFHSHHDSMRKGIGIVYQEIQVVPESSIAENIMLDKLASFGRVGIVNWRAVNDAARRYMEMVGLDLPPTRRIGTCSAAQKRLVQIAKALSANARVILLDEPTSTLTAHESDRLFGILRGLKANGVTMIFVSHKCEEVLSLCDKVTVLRDGRHVDTRPAAGLSRAELVRMMIGREYLEERLGQIPVAEDMEALRAEHVTRHGSVEDASFVLRRGEILGFYGLVGSGRTELARILIGEDRMDAGVVAVRGVPVRIGSIKDSLYRHRMGYVTENRKEEGLLLKDTVRTNIAITVWPRLVEWFSRRIRARQENAVARDMVKQLAIRTAGIFQVTETLSGGNQQKVSLAKWLAAQCDILIIDEPTVGVDVGAKQQIHQLIWDLAAKHGTSVIVISSDMPEIVKLARRILVFRNRRIVGEVTGVDNPAQSAEETSKLIGEHLH